MNRLNVQSGTTSDTPTTGARLQLCILCTCDLHMALRDYDYTDDLDTGRGGLTRLAPMIEDIRQAGGTVVLLDAGDTLQGEPTGDVLARDHATGTRAQHPMIEAMNVIGYDAAIAGNHDLNFGLAFARDSFEQAKFPYVLSHGPLRQQLGFAQSALLDRFVKDETGASHGLRIGIIGVLPPAHLARMDVDAACLETSRQIKRQLQTQIGDLRARGADLIVALTHSGVNETRGIPFVDHTVGPLAQMPGIDVIVCGHTHQVFPSVDPGSGRRADAGTGHFCGKPVVQAGYGGAQLGQVTLTLEYKAQAWQQIDAKVDVTSVQGNKSAKVESPELLRLSDALHTRTVKALRQPLAQLTHPMHNYFAALGHDRCGALIGQAKIAFARTRAQSLGLGDLPVLALTSPFRAGGGDAPRFVEVTRGALLVRHLCAIYPFPNRLQLLRLNRAQIYDIADATARKFNDIVADVTDQKLTAETVPCYEIETFRGLTCTLDLSARPDARIVGIDLHCGAYSETEEFLVAISDFRASALGLDAFVVAEADTTVPELLRAHFEAQTEVTPVAPPGWIFAPVSGASVKLRTGIGARRFLGDIAPFRPQDLGTDARGFLWLRIHMDPGP